MTTFIITEATKKEILTYIAENGIDHKHLGYTSKREMVRTTKADLANAVDQFQKKQATAAAVSIDKKPTRAEKKAAAVEEARRNEDVADILHKLTGEAITATEAIKRMAALEYPTAIIASVLGKNPSFVANVLRGAYERNTITHDAGNFEVAVAYQGQQDDPKDARCLQILINACSDQELDEIAAKPLREAIVAEFARMREDITSCTVKTKGEPQKPTRSEKKMQQLKAATADAAVAEILLNLQQSLITKSDAIAQLLALNYSRPVVAEITGANPSFVANVDRGAYERILLTVVINDVHMDITYVGKRDEEKFLDELEERVGLARDRATINEAIRSFKFVSKVEFLSLPDAQQLDKPEMPEMPTE